MQSVRVFFSVETMSLTYPDEKRMSLSNPLTFTLAIISDCLCRDELPWGAQNF